MTTEDKPYIIKYSVNTKKYQVTQKGKPGVLARFTAGSMDLAVHKAEQLGFVVIEIGDRIAPKTPFHNSAW